MISLEDPLLTTSGLQFYRRFLDDIFFVWRGNLLKLQSNLIAWLPLSIFQLKRSFFLDMVVCVDQENPTELITMPYQNHSINTCTSSTILIILHVCETILDYWTSTHMKEVFSTDYRIEDTLVNFFFFFSEVQYDSRKKYLSTKRDNSKDISRRLCFNRVPHVHLKSLFLYHLESGFDVTICCKATPNLSKFLVSGPDLSVRLFTVVFVF